MAKKMNLAIHKYYVLGCGAVIWTNHETPSKTEFQCQVVVPSPRKFSLRTTSDPITDKSLGHHLYSTWDKETGTLSYDFNNRRAVTAIAEVSRKEMQELRNKYKAAEIIKAMKVCGIKATVRGSVDIDKLKNRLEEVNSKYWPFWA